MAKISRDDFEALIRRTGLSLSPAEIEHMREGWALVEPMLERIRSHDLDRVAEPAHIFRADADMRGTDAP